MPLFATRQHAPFAVLAVSGAMFLSLAAHAAPLEAAGAIDAVTVYRGQALVSRAIALPADGNTTAVREIIVTNLPESLIPASLFAEASDGAEVRSVSYRIRPLPEDARAEVRAAEQRIRELGDQAENLRAEQKHHEWQRAYYEKLENYLTGTAVVENNKGVLNAETVAKMTENIITARAKLSQDSRKTALELRTVEEQLQLAQRELGSLAARSNRTAREALVLVNQTKPGAVLRLNYLVDRATWSPSYNLRAESAGASSVVVEYQASIQQTSGEDWPGVAMTLSTATPALLATGPAIEPLMVAALPPGGAGGLGGAAKDALALRERGYEAAQQEIAEKKMQLSNARASNLAFRNDGAGNFGVPGSSAGAGAASALSATPAAPPAPPTGFSGQVFADMDNSGDKGLNDLAVRSQLLDLLINEQVARRKPGQPSAATRTIGDSVAVTYAVPTRTTLASRSDQQLVQIARLTSPAGFAKVATPVLAGTVFNEADITNASDMVLLAGPAASYLSGEFVGRGRVPTVTVGETFSAGFGADSSLRTGRELVERTEIIQGGNKVVEFTYRLTVENFGKSAAKVRLLDRVPQPKGNDIRLTLVSAGKGEQQLSNDAAYQAGPRKQGILRWDLPVASGSGTSATTLEYTFRLEFDKAMSLTEVDAR
jgi:hypothetical protein